MRSSNLYKNERGDVIEGYEKLKTVGKGAFGTASLYRRLVDNLHVVMKEVFISDMTKEERNLALNEVEVLASLNHPNIIKYMDSFEQEGSLIIIMEYANAGNLGQLITNKRSKKETFSEKSILQIIWQISGALSYMHQNKILHRDLKTANIFLNKNGAVKIGDFGISKILSTKNQAQTVVGTPYYLSPEMCEGKDYNEKSDIWAFGCILYELVHLRRPFEAPTLPLLVQKITSCEIEDIPSDYSREINKLLHDILQRDMKLRPAAQFIHEIVVPDLYEKLENISTLVGKQIIVPNEKAFVERSVLYRMNLGDSSLHPYELPHKKIIDFSSSKSHCIALVAEHGAYVWGDNSFGQLALGKQSQHVKNPTRVEALKGNNIYKCSTGDGFSMFLNDKGQVFSCGNGKNGCLGQGDWNDLSTPKQIGGLKSFIVAKIACGAHHVLALTNNNRLFSWGLSKDGELGLENTQLCSSPTEIKYLNADHIAEKIFTGEDCSLLLLRSGQLMVCGNNSYNKLGIKNITKISTFTLVSEIKEEIEDVSVGFFHVVLLMKNGKLISMGKNIEGQLGMGNCKSYATPQVISHLHSEVIEVSCGPTYTVAATSENTIYFWGAKFQESNGNNSPEQFNSIVYSKQTSMNAFRKYADNILEPKIILALYSSPDNVKFGNQISFGGFRAHENHLLIWVHTTCPPPTNREDISEYPSSSVEPSWKTSDTTGRTTLPNTPIN